MQYFSSILFQFWHFLKVSLLAELHSLQDLSYFPSAFCTFYADTHNLFLYFSLDDNLIHEYESNFRISFTTKKSSNLSRE